MIQNASLLIDTTDPEKFKLELRDGSKAVSKIEKATTRLSEHLLSELDKLLRNNDVVPQDLEKIIVNPGPGPFSRVRTGVAVANALAFALGIPVVEYLDGREKQLALPRYDRAPNITKPKK